VSIDPHQGGFTFKIFFGTIRQEHYWEFSIHIFLFPIARLEFAKEQLADQAVESYKANFEKLLIESSPNLGGLVDEYTEVYQRNIRRFEYINELNKDVSSFRTIIGIS